MRGSFFIVLAGLALFGHGAARGQAAEVKADSVAGGGGPSAEGVEFFEKHIRPVLVARCYECHSAQAKKVKGGLSLDSREAIAAGGNNGAVILPGDVENSPLIHAIRWSDPDQAMPPKGKLAAEEIAKLEEWVRMGAPDPRSGGAGALPAKAKSRDLEADRRWWAFVPLNASAPPAVARPEWARTTIDFFVLGALEKRQLQPSAKADPRSLLLRLYLDLTGLRPSREEMDAFVRDPSEAAWAQAVDRLLASPQYGERWGRYWLDVARYAEDNPTTEASNPPYPNAWRYRDWVIDAVNRDLPYDQFVSLQLAADLMPGTARGEMAATGFLGIGPVYHKDARLSKDVIENLCMDDWDERVDVVSRGVLGLTVSCARCHDHKTDPISTRDYYALAGVFASTAAGPRPVTDVDPAVETRAMAAAQRLFYLSYVANLLRGDPGSSPVEARQKVEGFVRELESIRSEIADLRESHPLLHAQLAKLDRRPQPYEDSIPDKSAAATPEAPEAAPAAATNVKSPEASVEANKTAGQAPDKPDAPSSDGAKPGPGPTGAPSAVGANTVTANTVGADAAGANAGGQRTAGGDERGRRFREADPFFHSVFDAGVWVNGSDPDLTRIDLKPGVARDLPVLPGGNVAKPGEVVPRGFPVVLSKGDPAFREGSGRRELARKIFTDAAPLAARVMVNRVWGWHFGRPLVDTTSDFGQQCDKPTHPELLDDLAARFVAHGWSLKWLHRELVLSATYQQSSRTRPEAAGVDPDNRLLWRMNPRRLDAESIRDCLLQTAGTLDPRAGGPSSNADQVENTRRTVYSRISRGRAGNFLRLFDFPEASMHSPGRETTTTPLQQLFVMNSPFMRAQAEALVRTVPETADTPEKVRVLIRRVFLREPGGRELEQALQYLTTGTLLDYAHALLSTNELIFWP